MSIRQLNASYVADEDRVFFRFTTAQAEEYRLWLTRAALGQLLLQLRGLAVQVLEQKGHVQEPQVVAEWRQQALEQNAQYTHFEPGARLPLGAQPVLVKSVLIQQQGVEASLLLGLPAGKQLTLRLGEDLVGKLRLLLQRMNEVARWTLPLEVESQGAAVDAHGLAAEPPPKVLH